MTLSEDEIKMGFVASCIENIADKLNIDYTEVVDRLEKANLIDDYIFPCYEALHTESRENLTDELILLLKSREEK